MARPGKFTDCERRELRLRAVQVKGNRDAKRQRWTAGGLAGFVRRANSVKKRGCRSVRDIASNYRSKDVVKKHFGFNIHAWLLGTRSIGIVLSSRQARTVNTLPLFLPALHPDPDPERPSVAGGAR